MFYTDILLFQGADPDGINDANARILGVLHGINRAHGEHGDQHRQKGDYPLAIAFPNWQDPLLSAHKRLSSGTAGPILRLFGPEYLLTMLVQHKLIQSLELEGRAQSGQISAIPDTLAKWVKYSRYHGKEKQVSNSYQRRAERRRTLFKPKEMKAQVSDQEASSFKPVPFVYLTIYRKDRPKFSIPVRQILYNAKPDQALKVNSWGLVTEGALPYF